MLKSKKKKSDSKKNLKKIFLSFFSTIFIVLLIASYIFFDYVASGLPSLEQLENPKPQLASNVYSVDGELIGQYFRQNRIEININDVPEEFINALIATEDRKFYDHWGVDLERLVKAMVKNVFLMRREGASTITQQLSRNLYGFWSGKESSYDIVVRKIREWITAVQIESNYTKKEILGMYFNISYFGRGAYGIEMAARTYFGKKFIELDLKEMAVLVAMLKSPVVYDPIRRYNNSIQRRNLVLYNMVQMNMLQRERYDQLKEEPIDLSFRETAEGFKSNVAPHFVEHVRQQLSRMADRYGFDLYEDGLTIYTTLDTEMQRIAVNAAQAHLKEYQEMFDKRWNWNRNRAVLDDMLDKAIKRRPDYRNAVTSDEKNEIYQRLIKNVAFVDSVQIVNQTIEVGFVCLDVTTGEIRAMVGGRDQQFKYGLNHITQIRRQPGSAFKPIIYTVAVDNGLYPAYPILNQPFNYEGWEPQNFDRSTSGFVTLRDALRRSLNIVSGRLIIEDHVKLWQVGRYADRLGIKTKLDLYPAISLGASEVTPLELTAAFATIANHGIYNEPISILRIEDKDGIVIDNFSTETREAIPEETAYIITDMMKSVIDAGTGARIRTQFQFNRPAGGKTGTTQEFADAWFVGFTAQLAAGVWVGFDDRRVTFTGNYGQGSQAALPIWGRFMKDVYDKFDFPVVDFEPPASGNITSINFCSESIFELGDPRIYSSDCNSGVYTDIIKLKDIPPMFNSQRDTTIKIFEMYLAPDSSANEAVEIR
ncbi:multimodular transpeptidase-transglycosylase [hydrocarbon metagenome]|uniref:peptidoglycan glycosyltransferase n=1 Tax=hydrocarbon metagenome TaxID=938273 RepID=A0A0W8FZH6_9ZZZZ